MIWLLSYVLIAFFRSWVWMANPRLEEGDWVIAVIFGFCWPVVDLFLVLATLGLLPLKGMRDDDPQD